MDNDTARDAQILIIGEDLPATPSLAVYFEKAGYSVTASEKTAQLAERIKQQRTDLLILHSSPPGTEDLSLIRELRARSAVGIILVTDGGDEIDRIIGLEMGADDYVTSPYNPRELLVRAKNLLWRMKASSAGREENATERCFEGWKLNAPKRLLTAPDSACERLPEGEFKLLQALISHPGQVLSRDQLMDAVRDRQWIPSDRSVDVLVGRLRRKLRDSPADPHFILTAHGAGYLFAGELA